MRTRGGKRIFLLFHVFYLQVKIQEEEGEGEEEGGKKTRPLQVIKYWSQRSQHKEAIKSLGKKHKIKKKNGDGF